MKKKSRKELEEEVADLQAELRRRRQKMGDNPLTKKVVGIISDKLGVPEEEIDLESSFVDDLKADSLDIVELVMRLEDEFDIKIPDEDYDIFKTVRDVVDYIEKKLK